MHDMNGENGTLLLVLAAIATVSTACGGGSGNHAVYTLGGGLSGLAGSGLVLQDGAGHTLNVSANATSFTFATALANGTMYAVSVKTQPTNPSQTCVVSNGDGTLDSNFNAISVVCTTNTYTVGGIIAGLAGSGLVLGDGKGAIFSAPPNGAYAFSNFRFSPALASGASYNVTVLSQPSGSPPQFCSVANPSGTVTSANINNVSVTCNGPFVYIANASNISGYTMNVRNGALSAIAGSPFETNANGAPIPYVIPFNLIFDANARFAYAANFFSNDISVLAINTATGALAPIAGSPFAAGTNPQILTIHPSGKFAYVANSGSNNVSAYSMDTTTGALTPVVGSPFVAGTASNSQSIYYSPSVIIDPTGKFAYVLLDGSISAYTIDGTTGALMAVAGSPFAVDSGPGFIIMNPQGSFIYAIASGGIYGYAINASTGALTTVVGSPYVAGTGPFSITIDPSGGFIYVSTYTSGPQYIPSDYALVAYAINPVTGALTAVPGSPFAAGGGYPEALTFGPGEDCGFVT
jgi:DNA-binding beta-propeller fold protein YncE